MLETLGETLLFDSNWILLCLEPAIPIAEVFKDIPNIPPPPIPKMFLYFENEI